MQYLRPNYGNAVQTQRERALLDLLAARRRCNWWPLNPNAYSLDAALWTEPNVIHCLVEVKCRNMTFGFGTFFISLSKVIRGLQLQRLTGLPTEIVVQFEDRVAFTPMRLRDTSQRTVMAMDEDPDDLGRLPNKVLLAGRTDRADDFDVEPCVIYPWDSFVGLD